MYVKGRGQKFQKFRDGTYLETRHNIPKRGYFAEARMRPILKETNAIVRILGKSVSPPRSR